MFLRRDRVAMAKKLLGILAVVVIVVGAAVVYPLVGLGSPASSTSASTSSTILSAASASSSSVGSTAATSTSSGPHFNFALTALPVTILITPGGNLSYARINVIPLPSALPNGTEDVSLSVKAPSGIFIRLHDKSVKISIDSQMSLQGSEPPYTQFALAAAKDTPPGDYTVSVTATSGPITATNSFTVRVTPYLIIVMSRLFNPSTLTVRAGGTVYWLSMGMGSGGDSSEEYNVIFDKGNIASDTLFGFPHYDSFSHTFTTPGVYGYYDTLENVFPYMNGTIIVTA